MKAMILAAGRGERLRPLTDQTPKPLIYAGDKRIIEYLLEALSHAGIEDIVINYAHLGEQFPKTLGSGAQYGVRIHYSAENEGGLETAGGIVNALPLLDEDVFLVVNGDIWTDFNFSQLVTHSLDESTLAHLIMVKNPAHNPDGDFVKENSGLLSSKGSTKYTFSGIGLYRRQMFENHVQGKRALKPLFDDAIDRKALTGELYTGAWSDIGTVERLKQLELELKGS